MKKNNKGFTLVELIVVLVILAILAAILVPALLGYIDRAREKQVTTNAEAALVAAQGKMADAFGAYADPATDTYVKAEQIQKLTDIEEGFTFAYKTSTAWSSASQKDKKCYKITEFAYYSATSGKTATWSAAKGGNWVVTQTTSDDITLSGTGWLGKDTYTPAP